MSLKALIPAALAALALVPAALARPFAVMPGVTYDHVLRWTPAGPVSLYVIRAPRPGGLYGLKPALSNGTLLGRETVSSMERDVSAKTTSIGVNGDLFNWNDGYPTGVLMQGGVLEHHPSTGRSSIGVDTGGALHVDRVALSATWGAQGLTEPLGGVNEPTRPNQARLFTPVWGAATPAATDTTEVVLSPFSPAAPNTTLTGTVAVIRSGGGTPIPAGGAVLVGRGNAGLDLLGYSQVGGQVTVRLGLTPSWAGVTDALGGGPLLVRGGKPVFEAGEAFAPSQIRGRNPRTAVGQRADGGIVIVAADGRQPGWSIGVSDWELAQELVRDRCVTGSALDSGGSTAVAFDGHLLSRPSDSGGERPVAEALLVTYDGVYAPPLGSRTLSPNGDGAGERSQVAFKLVRPTALTAQLLGPGGIVRDMGSGQRAPGRFALSWTGANPDGTPAPEGRWDWRLTAVDDLGRTSKVDRPFTLDTTLGFLRVRPGRRGALRISYALTRPASVRTTIESPGGEVLRTVDAAQHDAGTVSLGWNGRDGRHRRLARGAYDVRVRASGPLGLSLLQSAFVLR